MIAVGKEMCILPTFDIQSYNYEPYEGVPLSCFDTEVGNYYLNKNDRYTFDIDSYFDLIIAPYYVVEKTANNNFTYSRTLKDLFLLLFSTPAKYECLLESGFYSFKTVLNNHRNAFFEINEILNSLKPIKQSFDKIFSVLSQVEKSRVHFKYIEVSKNFLDKIQNNISIFEKELLTTPTSLLEPYYYFNNSHLSWRESPFAFFRNIIFNEGLGEIKQALDYESQFFGRSEIFEDFIERYYEIEIRKTYRIIEDAMLELKKKHDLKQKFMNSVCASINNLYELSFRTDCKSSAKR